MTSGEVAPPTKQRDDGDTLLLNPALSLTIEDRLVLKAALGPADSLAKSYQDWRSRVALENIGVAAFRLLPAVVHRTIDQGIWDPELPKLKGVIRQTWLANQLRIRSLTEALQALSATNVDAMVLKGAALFARYPQFIMMRGTGDYDILVRRSDAAKAAKALLSAGFIPQIVRIDRFEATDFDRIHGVHLMKSGHQDSLDLHWQPLPSFLDERLIEEIFSRSEQRIFGGHQVRVPGLADHLALTVARAATWDSSEFALRTAEAAFLLKACNGDLEWPVFFRQTRLLRCRGVAWQVIDFIQSQLEIRIANDVIAELGGWRSIPAVRGVKRLIPSDTISSAIRIGLDFRQAARRRLHRVRAGHRGAAGVVRDRMLNRAWTKAAAEIKPLLGDKADFARGFSFPETEGRWTDGKLAILRLPINLPGESIDLRVTAIPFYPPGTTGFVFDVISWPGRGRQHLLHRSEGSPARFTVENVPLLSQRYALLVFRMLDAATPKLYGLSDDVRALGLLISRIEVLRQGSVVHCFEIGASPIIANAIPPSR